MQGQFVDKKTVGIPPDIVRVRADCENFSARAEGYAENSAQSSIASAESASASAAHAMEAHEYALQAQGWSELHSQGIHFGPNEPFFENRYDGMLWIKTDEQAQTITEFNRWDAGAYGSGLFLSDELYLSDELFLRESGEWKTFHVV